MKNYLLTIVLCAAFATVQINPAQARQNPAVQPIFFEHLEQALPANQRAPTFSAGVITEVTLEELAWAVDNLKNDPVPLVIEFYSSKSADCAVDTQSGINECQAQAGETPMAAAQYPGRVKFLRIDASKYPVLLNGPDVRVLPAHIVIASYADATHYTAVKVGGYLSQTDLQSLIDDVLSIAP